MRARRPTRRSRAALDDLRRLKAMEGEGVAGAIIGRALYDGSIDLAEALKAERE